jgi:hypothetical protein
MNLNDGIGDASALVLLNESEETTPYTVYWKKKSMHKKKEKKTFHIVQWKTKGVCRKKVRESNG